MAKPRLRSATLGFIGTFTKFHKTILGLAALMNAFLLSPCVAEDQSPNQPRTGTIALFAEFENVGENLLTPNSSFSTNDGADQFKIQTGLHGTNIHQALNSLISNSSENTSRTNENYAHILSVTTQEIDNPHGYYSQESLNASWAIDGGNMIDSQQTQGDLTQARWQKNAETNHLIAASINKSAPESSTLASVTGITGVGLFTGIGLAGAGLIVNRRRKKEKPGPEPTTLFGVPAKQHPPETS